jgi:hypothetical protein
MGRLRNAPNHAVGVTLFVNQCVLIQLDGNPEKLYKMTMFWNERRACQCDPPRAIGKQPTFIHLL